MPHRFNVAFVPIAVFYFNVALIFVLDDQNTKSEKMGCIRLKR